MKQCACYVVRVILIKYVCNMGSTQRVGDHAFSQNLHCHQPSSPGDMLVLSSCITNSPVGEVAWVILNKERLLTQGKCLKKGRLLILSPKTYIGLSQHGINKGLASSRHFDALYIRLMAPGCKLL